MEPDNYTIYDDFLHSIDLSIETGDINYVKEAIIKYKGILNQYYIDWGNRIIIELTTEAIEEMTLVK
tara:strand:+ start:3318 stop:3518 length:201 start_codon:yes stop_codon:yes gene_type:complete